MPAPGSHKQHDSVHLQDRSVVAAQGVSRDGGRPAEDEIPELEAVEEEGPVDETGVDPKDIELVIQQVGCSRAKAVKVLKESGGDLINASA